MAKVFGILLIVLALWWAADTQLGMFDASTEDADDGATVSRAQYTRDKVTAAHEQAEARLEKLLPE